MRGFFNKAVEDPIVKGVGNTPSDQTTNDDLKKLNERLREQLRAQEAELRRLALVAARTDNAVVITDAQGVIEWVNEGFTRMTGWTLEECVGRTPGSFLHGSETNPETVEYVHEQVRQGKAFQVEVLKYNKSGAPYWTAIDAQPILDAEGKLINFMAIEANITQRRRDEQRRALQFLVSRSLAGAESVRHGAARVLEGMGNRMACSVGNFWMLDAASGELHLLETWSNPVEANAPFIEASRILSCSWAGVVISPRNPSLCASPVIPGRTQCFER